MKPGGLIFFRDYGYGDLAQIKLSSKTIKPQKIEENFYVKEDGTRCYYFKEGIVISKCLIQLFNYHFRIFK